nr:hypothetical protein [Tanacetum cinerariifolium]
YDDARPSCRPAHRPPTILGCHFGLYYYGQPGPFARGAHAGPKGRADGERGERSAGAALRLLRLSAQPKRHQHPDAAARRAQGAGYSGCAGKGSVAHYQHRAEIRARQAEP